MSKKIQFPDPNVEQEFEAPNGKTYVWNGFGWEIECGGGDVKDEYLPLAGGNMEGSVQFNPKPFNGLTVFGSEGKDYNNVSKIIFKAENGGTYSDPQVIVGVEPTAVNHATTKKYVDDKADNYVLTSGDTMTGDLIVNATVHADVVETLVVDSGENSNLVLKHDGNTKVYVGSSQVTIQNPLKLNTEGTDDAHAVTKKYIDDIEADFTLDQQRQDDELAAEVQARAERDLLHDAQIDTIEYKLEALIGVTFRGTYEFKHDQSCEDEYQECMANCISNDARCETDCLRAYSECEENNVDPGFFEAIDPDGQFDNLQEIIISKNDKSNVEIDWAGVLAKDDYLEVDHVLQGQLDKTNYGLYRILEEPEAKTNTKGEVVYVMKLQFLQGDGVLNEKEFYEIRGITAAEGVNPEELGDFLTKTDAAATYLPLIGGTLTGNLFIDKAVGGSTNTEAALTLTGSRSNTQNAAATISFKNDQASNAIGYLTYRSYGGNSFFKFNQDVDLGSNGLSGVDHIELKNSGYLGSGDKPRIRVRNGGGNNNQAGTDIQRPGDGMRTFAIKGKPSGSGNVEDFFWAYGNTTNGDAINYTGLTTAANHIVTKKYVDSKMPQHIITETNGNYYIS